jgi:hypothetical protein
MDGLVDYVRRQVLYVTFAVFHSGNWTFRGSNSGGGGAKFSAPVQNDPGAHPSSCTMRTGAFSRGVNRPERGVDHPPAPSVDVKERVELYLYSPSGPSRPVIG